MKLDDAGTLAAAQRSLQAVGRGDRSGWVGLFTPDGRVEDPVGSRPHTGYDQIAAFFDTFIGPRQISYRSTADIVTGSTVIRDLTLDVRMGSTVTMAIPAFLRYVVRESQGDVKIAELQAFWDLPSMIAQFAGNGLRAIPVGLKLGGALLVNQRLGGSVGFLLGLRRVGRPQRLVAGALLDALSGADEITTRRLLSGATVILGDDKLIGLDRLADGLRGATFTKEIAAGRCVAVSSMTETGRGVVIADFGADQAISRLRYFAP